MSYGGIGDYAGYYRSANNQAPQRRYGAGTSGQSGETYNYPDPKALQNSVAHPQYDVQDYNWPSQNQNSYRMNNEQGDGNETGRSSGQQQPTHDYQRSAENAVEYSRNANAGQKNQDYYPSPTTTSCAINTLGLNSLAYVSGLEAADSNTSTNTARHSNNSASQYSSPQSRNTGINRTKSPAQNGLQHSNPTQPNYVSPPRSAARTQRTLPSYAAEALSGAISRKHQSADSQSGYSVGQPTMGNTSSNIAQPRQVTVSPRPALDNSSHARQQSEQTSVNHVHASPPRPANLTSSPQVRQTPAIPAHETSQKTISTTQTRGSLANLVTNDVWPPKNSTVTSEADSSSMPTYIAPLQIFNPYHREHAWRKKREAVEAEANRKAAEEAQRRAAEEAAAKAAMVANQAAQSLQAVESLSTTTREDAPSSKISRAKRSHKAKQPKKSLKTPVQAPATSPPSSNTQMGEGDMDVATELKLMMNKMKALKNKDPSLFQKAWEELKSGSAAEPSKVPSTGIWQATITGQNTSGSQSQVATLSDDPNQTQSSNRSVSCTPDVCRKKGGLKGDYSGFQGALNGYHVLVENNPEGLPDIGRFPAERRVRTKYSQNAQNAQQREQPQANLSTNPQQNAMQGSAKTSAFQVASPQKPAQQVPGPTRPMNEHLPLKADAGTVWPAHKRNALAIAAIYCLKSSSENASIDLKADDIHSLLDRHPSYIDLCMLLEGKGLKFDRAEFARHLLANVPDISGHKYQQAPGSGVTGAAPTAAQQLQATQPASSQALQHTPAQPGVQPYYGVPMSADQVMGPTNLYLRPPWFASMTYHMHPQGVPPPRQESSKPKPKPKTILLRLPPPPPGSKEAQARKRDFSELVDFTELSDTEHYVMPPKKPREKSPSPEQDPIAAYEQRMVPLPPLPPQPHPSASQPWARYVQSNETEPSTFISPSNIAQGTPNAKTKAILAKPINKNEALRKSYYNPKTVAKDILIGAGRHPVEKPLNAHLANMLGYHIDLDSDLSTFDWDAITPGGPKAPTVEFVDVPAAPPRFKLGTRKRMRDASQPLLSITKDALGAAGLSNEQNVTAKTSPTMPATSLGLFTNFQLQTHNLLKQSRKPRTGRLHRPSGLRNADLVGSDSDHPSARAVTPQKPKSSNGTSSPPNPPPSSQSKQQNVRFRTSRRSLSVQTPIMDAPKRRGRPPGSRNKQARISHVKKAATTAVTAASVDTAPPLYHVYKCRWRLCEAQLHNLPTLRKHVAKVHRSPPKDAAEKHFACWWKNCEHIKKDSQGSPIVDHFFESQVDLIEHVETHLQPIGSKFGDGPSTVHIGKHVQAIDLSEFVYDPSRDEPGTRTVSYLDPQSIARDKANYLSDENDRTTTFPAVSSFVDPDMPTDAIALTKATTDPDEQAHIKAFMRVHGNKKFDVKKMAEETLRAMKARKEQIGPGMDRGGCTLVNEARRTTLVQDGDIARVIEFDFE